MIRQHFYIKKYSWEVVVLYDVDANDVEYIKKLLTQICNDYGTIQDGVKYIQKGDLNSGFIYSNYDRKASVIVIGKATSKQELFNTIVHETSHLQSHISTKWNIDDKGEEAAYLIGDIVQKMYKVFKYLI